MSSVAREETGRPEAAPSVTRIVIIDPAAAFQARLREGLAPVEGLEVVGEAATLEEGSLLVSEAMPDLVLFSLDTPDATELEYARRLCQGASHPSAITLVPQDDEAHIYGSIAIGAAACLPHDTPCEYIISTIQRVVAGERPIQYSLLSNADVAAHVLQRFLDTPGVPASPDLPCPLSPREIQVLQEIARGRSNKEIGNHLGISEQTVKNHISAILHKLGANDRTHAAILALRNGWIAVG